MRLHDLGLVHSDVKLANYFIGMDGRIFLGDHSLAHVSDNRGGGGPYTNKGALDAIRLYIHGTPRRQIDPNRARSKDSLSSRRPEKTSWLRDNKTPVITVGVFFRVKCPRLAHLRQHCSLRLLDFEQVKCAPGVIFSQNQRGPSVWRPAGGVDVACAYSAWCIDGSHPREYQGKADHQAG